MTFTVQTVEMPDGRKLYLYSFDPEPGDEPDPKVS